MIVITILFALLTALLTASGAVFYKLGIKGSEPYSVTAVKSISVIVATLIYAYFTGAFVDITSVGGLDLFYLILSGIALGGGWLFYFYAIKSAELIRAQPISNLQPVVLMLFSLLFLYDRWNLLTAVAITLAGAGTVLMSWKKGNKRYMLFAWLSVGTVSVSAFLRIIGAYAVGTAISFMVQAIVILIMLVIIGFAKGKKNVLSGITLKGSFFTVLGVAVIALACLSAQQVGAINGIDLDRYVRLAVLLLTVVGGRAFLKEKPSAINIAGLVLVISAVVVSIF